MAVKVTIVPHVTLTRDLLSAWNRFQKAWPFTQLAAIKKKTLADLLARDQT